jgi:hypothetical protein
LQLQILFALKVFCFSSIVSPSLLSFASFLFLRKKRKTDFTGKFFSLLSFVSPKERSKEKEPEIDVRPISEGLDEAFVLL